MTLIEILEMIRKVYPDGATIIICDDETGILLKEQKNVIAENIIFVFNSVADLETKLKKVREQQLIREIGY